MNFIENNILPILPSEKIIDKKYEILNQSFIFNRNTIFLNY